MQKIEQLSKDIEKAIAHHDNGAMQQVIKDMQSWKAHGESKGEITEKLYQVNAKLHHDGYLPHLNIIGFEHGREGKLIVNPSHTSDRFTVDKNLKQRDQHNKELNHSLVGRNDHRHLDQHNGPVENQIGKLGYDKATTQKMEKLEARRGVQIEQKEGKFLYHLKANGKDEVVCKTEASTRGLEEGDARMRKLIEQKESQLAKTYRVSFCKTGEDAVPRDSQHPEKGYIKARMPQLDELAGIEASLKHSQPSQLADGKLGSEGVKFYFLSEKSSGNSAYYAHDKQGKPAVFMEPDQHRYPTEKGATGNQVRDTVESVLTHELAHNMQHNMDWDKPSVQNYWAQKIGWVQSAANQNEYFMQDKNGGLFKYDSTSNQFMHCDNRGEPLDKHGHIVKDPAKALHLKPGNPDDRGADTMFGRAKVEPGTHYFTDPMEMFADGMQLYRLDQNRRAELLFESPNLYKACQQQDQQELDKVYGARRKLRSPDGDVVDYSHDNLQRIKDFENRTMLVDTPEQGVKATAA